MYTYFCYNVFVKRACKISIETRIRICYLFAGRYRYGAYMKNLVTIMIMLLTCPGVLFAQETNPCSDPECAQPDPRQPCWDAILGTAGHFSVGDGKNSGVYVELGGPGGYGPPPGIGFGSTIGGIDHVMCFAEGANCPLVPPAVDSHDIPGIVTCSGCTDRNTPNQSTVTTSVNGMKCCLKWGYTTPPAGQSC